MPKKTRPKFDMYDQDLWNLLCIGPFLKIWQMKWKNKLFIIKNKTIDRPKKIFFERRKTMQCKLYGLDIDYCFNKWRRQRCTPQIQYSLVDERNDHHTPRQLEIIILLFRFTMKKERESYQSKLWKSYMG